MSVQNAYEQSKKYSDHIMDLVKTALTKKKVKFESNPKDTEIRITSKSQSKDSIKKILESVDKEISEPICKTLLEIAEVSGKVFIRQKTK